MFISLPIFNNLSHVLSSKHFRRNEHFWYFTHDGLVHWFSENGFDFIEFTNEETKLGRDGILTYAFRRRKNG